MIVTAHQPVYHPWLGLLAKIAMADTFISFDSVQFERKGWQSRQAIRTWPKGERLYLTVPTYNAGHQDGQTILSTRIKDDGWRKKHHRSIEQNYRRAPHWDRYAQFFETLYGSPWEYLEELNTFILEGLLNEFRLGPTRHALSTLQATGAVGKDVRGNQLVLDAVAAVGGDFYLFGEEGLQYADPIAWRSRRIGLGFQFFSPPRYPQMHPGSDTGVWAFDLLLNHGPDRARAILLKERDHEPADQPRRPPPAGPRRAP